MKGIMKKGIAPIIAILIIAGAIIMARPEILSRLQGQIVMAPAIIDDGDPDFTTTGTWSTAALSCGYNGDYTYETGATLQTAKWSFGASGTYEISAHWCVHSARPDAVPYKIRHSAGITTVYVNQKRDAAGNIVPDFTASGWKSLGTYTFSGAYEVEIDTSSAGDASADAISIGAAPAPTTTTTTICTNSAPAAAVLISPANNASIPAGSAFLDWNPPATWGAYCGTQDNEYDIYFQLNTNPPAIKIMTLEQPFTDYTTSPLSAGVYYWFIRTRNGFGGLTADSEIRSFTAGTPTTTSTTTTSTTSTTTSTTTTSTTTTTTTTTTITTTTTASTTTSATTSITASTTTSLTTTSITSASSSGGSGGGGGSYNPARTALYTATPAERTCIAKNGILTHDKEWCMLPNGTTINKTLLYCSENINYTSCPWQMPSKKEENPLITMLTGIWESILKLVKR